ncbi:MAG: hypothetical protein NUV67_02260, partial [archaeon]|nr:hypothetical protein [archaeon]
KMGFNVQIGAQPRLVHTREGGVLATEGRGKKSHWATGSRVSEVDGQRRRGRAERRTNAPDKRPQDKRIERRK